MASKQVIDAVRSGNRRTQGASQAAVDAVRAQVEALQPSAPATPAAADNRYQNYLDMGDILRQESQADKGVALSPQRIMAEFMKQQQNGTEPVAQLTNPESTGARIRRYEDNRQRLAELEERIRGYGQAVLHPGKNNTQLQGLMAQREGLRQENERYERLYKSADYGTDARKQADFTTRATVQPHEDDPEYIAVNFDRYQPSAEKVNRIKASQTYADMTEPGVGIWDEKDALYQLDDILRDAWTRHNKSGYRNMTDEERDTYNYLYETRGKDTAHQYLQDQIIDVDKRESQKRVENFATAYDGAGGAGKALLNAMTVPASVFGGTAGAISDALSAMSGKYNPYTTSHAMTEFAQTVRGKTAEEIAAGINNETVGAFASNTYQAILSAADSVLGAFTMGHGYTIAMGAGATSSRAKELYEQGTDSKKVLLGSVAAGVAESLFEYVSLDKLIQTGESRSLRELIGNILKQSFTEASEEVSTEIANKVTDALIRGKQSDHSRAVEAYIEAGETAENAKRLAWRDDATDILWAGYGGAVSGGLSAGVYGGIGTAQNIRAIEEMGRPYLAKDSEGNNQLGAVMALGITNAKGTEGYALAERMMQQIESGRQPTAYQVGRLLMESTTQQAIRARTIEGEVLDSARELGVDDKKAQAVAALAVRADRAVRFVSPETLQTTGETGGQYSIVTLEDGKTYVISDRNVVSGEDSKQWRKQVTQFFNDVLLQNGSLTVETEQGDRLTITKNETLWKGTDRHVQTGGEKKYLTEGQYYVKLQALSHIDELAETAQIPKGSDGRIQTRPDTKNHPFAKDGFAYPTAFFEDADGRYYRITFSMGMNGDVATLYNIGRIQKTDAPIREKTLSVRGSKALGASASDTTIPQNGAGVNTQSMQNGENYASQAYGRYTADGAVELAANIATEEAMEFVLKHELTHAIEGSDAYEKLQRLVRQQMGEEAYAAAIERERQNRRSKGDTAGTQSPEAEVVADWIGENLYRDGFARLIRNMDHGAAVRFQAILDGFRRTLGFTKNHRQAAAIRAAERAFADVLDSDYSRSDTGGEQYSIRPGAREDVERVLAGENIRGDIQLTETSPAIITEQSGARNLPLMMKASHIRENVFTEAEAGSKGMRTGSNIHYHGLGKDLFLQVIDGLNDVTVAYRGTKNADNPARRENYFLLVSQYKDRSGNIINVPVYINETGQYNEVFIETNKLATVFGKENFYQYVDRQVRNGNLVRIKRKSTQASERTTTLVDGYSKGASSDTTIPQNGAGVNTQSMQNTEKNSVDGQKSYLPTGLQERENAAQAEKAENARRLAEEQTEERRQQETESRRQREETAAELRRKNAALEQRLERAQRETQLTTDKTVREEDVTKLTRKILREYSSTLKSDHILDVMQALGDTIVQGGQLDYDTLHGQALDIARQIIDHSETLIDDGLSDTYDGIRQYLRENKIAVSEEEKADIPDYEAWRRRNQRRLNLSKEGTPVDVIYGEMQELFGKGLLPDILNPSEQLQYLAELRDNMEPEYGNPYESDMEQAAQACAGDILDGMLSAEVRQTAPTYADKAQAQLEKQKNLAHAALEREVQRRHKALETQRNRYRDMLTREKVKTAEARVQGEKAVQETKAANRQRNREAAEGRKKTAEKQRIGKMLDSLESMLAHPDKNHHIPADATAAVRDLLAAVREDPGDIQQQINELRQKMQETSDGRQIARLQKRIDERKARLEKTRSLYESVARVEDTYQDIAGKDIAGKNANSGFLHYIQEVKKMVDDRTVRDLSADEIHELVDMVKAIHGQLKQMNTLHSKSFKEGAYETGMRMAQEMADAKGYKSSLIRNMILWQLTPDRCLEAMCGWRKDSVGAKIAQDLIEAQQKQLEISRAYNELLDPLVNGENAANYARLSSTKEGDLVDLGLVDSRGKPMKTTRGVMMSLYESLCCKGNRQAMLDGGLILPELRLYYKGNIADAYVQGQALTPTALSEEIHRVLEEMENFPRDSQEHAELTRQYTELMGRANQDLDNLKTRIEGEMTDYERQLHQTLRQWFDKDSKQYLNDTTTQLWNYEAARVKDYFPIYRSKNFVTTNMESLISDRTLASNGNLKARVHSKAPVHIADISEVLRMSAEQTARFCGWAAFQEDFTRIYNAGDTDKGMSFKTELGKKWGLGDAKVGVTGEQYIQNLMADISGGRDGGSSFLRFFRQNAVRATLTLNMRVAVSQAASLPTAAAEIGWQYTGRALKHLKEVNAETMDRIADYSAYFYERRRGAGGMEEFALAKGGSNLLDKGYQALDKATKGKLLNWCQEVDIRTVALCWFGCEEAIQDTRPELKKGSKEYYEAVGQMLDRVIIKTQPNFTTAQRSDLLRSKNEAIKFLTMYKTQANQNMNILYEVTGRLRAALQSGDQAQIKAAKQNMVNGYTAVIAGGTIAFVLFRTLVNLLQHRTKGYRDKDGEITAASMAGAIGQEVLSSMAGMFAFGDAVYDVVSARVFGERYYGVSDVALGNISSLLEDFATGNFRSGTAWKNLFRDTMNALGIPWKNLEDIAGGIINHAVDIAHGEFLSFNANSGVETTAYYRQRSTPSAAASRTRRTRCGNSCWTAARQPPKSTPGCGRSCRRRATSKSRKNGCCGRRWRA